MAEPTPTTVVTAVASADAVTVVSPAAGAESAGPPRRRQRRSQADPTRWHLDAAEEAESEGWLITYLDLITLMLVMLVVLLAFGRSTALPEPGAAAQAPAGADSVGSAVPAAVKPDVEGADPWRDLPRDHFGDEVELIVNAESISFRINDAILFPSGEAELGNSGVRVLERLLPTLAATPHQLIVEGHTDDQPIGTLRFPSNWELSTARAARVVRYFERRGIDPARLRATGYAATRPIADNRDPQQRSRNRRVELILQRGD